MNRIKKGDEVYVVGGREKGNTGKVRRMTDGGERAIIEKLNMVKRHKRRSEKLLQGGIVDKEAPIHISNIRLMSRKTRKPVRIVFKTIEQAGKMKKVRFAPETEEIFE